MSVSHRVLDGGSLLICEAEGAVDDAQLRAYLQRLLGDASIRADRRALVDCSGIDHCDVTGDGVRDAARMAEPLFPAGSEPRVALFAPSDVAYGLARMYATLVDPLAGEVRAFRERAEAVAWLGLPSQPSLEGRCA